MLTENSFEEIGKRLRDTEADPPAQGWNKIHRELHPAGRTNGAFFKRHWWKGLFLLIPVITYFTLTSIGPRPSQMASNLSSPDQAIEQDNAHADVAVDSQRVSATEPHEAQGHALSGESQNNAGTIRRLDKSRDSQQKIALHEKTPVQDEHISGSRTAESRIDEETTPSLQRAELIDATDSSPKKEAVTLREISATQEEIAAGDMVRKEPTPVEDVSSRDEKNTTPIGSDNDLPKPSTYNSNAEKESRTSESIAGVSDGINDKANSARTTENAEQLSTNGAGEIRKEGVAENNSVQSDHAEKHGAYAVAPPHLSLSTDSTARDNVSVDLPQHPGEEKTGDEGKDEDQKSYKPWRLNVGIVPTYVYRPVKPITSDEVLVTDFKNKKSNYPERIGFGFLLGGAKALNENLTLDASLSFNRISEELSYSYSTGVVDTLLAVQQPDGSVKVNPVYVVNSTEMRSKITFGNIRLGATYYFWQRARSRFNLSVFGGLDFVVASKVEEQRNGVWRQTGSGNIDKMNYNLGLSGGYNMNLSKGWELTINPMLTYYPLKNNQKEQLFSFDQRSYGLNIMLSKWF